MAAVAIGADRANADKTTVCTITVNSADEKEAFRRSLPADKFRFVELVERGRSDWLASACRQQIRCDILVVSGHYDGGNEFFSDRLETNEYLPVDEMERASCSASCSELFSHLKEVYLFGCNTLNSERLHSAPAEIARDLVRSGHSPGDAERLARALSTQHGDSSRDRMRQIFPNVPVTYGFSSVAPLGPIAASKLSRYFHSGPSEVGSGRTSGRLVGNFAGHSFVAMTGSGDTDPIASAARRDVCQFSDDRSSPAEKIAFIHRLLGRELAEVRLMVDRIERYTDSLHDGDRELPAVAQALDAIARDHQAKSRYLDFARTADKTAVRTRLLAVAHKLAWLSADELRSEWVRAMSDALARNAVGPAEIDVACKLNADGSVDAFVDGLEAPANAVETVAASAVRACFGAPDGHATMIRALTRGNDEDVQIAEVYLRHRPIADVRELRDVTAQIATMPDSRAKARALEALSRQSIHDRESLDALARIYPRTESAGVQVAIAGILLRSDYTTFAGADVAQTLRQFRRKVSTSEDMVDVLIRRLEKAR